MPTVRTSEYETPAKQDGVIDQPWVKAHVLHFKHASVVRKTVGPSGLNGAEHDTLSIQVIDAYRYQRELSIKPVHNTQGKRWRVTAYQHPFRPSLEAEVSPDVAARLRDRIWELATKHPILLFNEDNEGKTDGRHEGFVHFHDRLLAGAKPSIKLLN